MENNVRFRDEENFLNDENINLKEEAESEEEESLPPEEEKGNEKELNAGNIFAFIFIGLILIILILMVATNGKKKNKKENPELDKSGTKTEISWGIKEKPPVEEAVDILNDETNSTEEKKDNVDNIINNLPPEFQINSQQGQPSTAPVSPLGQTPKNNSYSSSSSKPDTRNSKSPRKIEGIKGQDNSSSNNYNSNSSKIANALNGNYNYGQNISSQSNLPPSKDEYISNQLAQMQQQYSVYNQNNANNSSMYYQTNKEGFFNSQANTAGNGNYLSYNCLWDGTVISGALITAINTDNPGIVVARVTENVWSSYDQSLLLIPEGSLLYATYNSSVSYGQNRVQVAWNLLIRPDGYRVELGNMNGVDPFGASGYKGFVNNHPFETLKALGLVAVFSVIQTEITSEIDSSENDYVQNAMTDVYSEASKIGNKILDKALDISPTISIKQGTEIKIITNTSLELPPVQIPQIAGKYVRNE